MPFATFIGGTLVPVLLMLSPLAVMAAKDCAGWAPTARAVEGGKQKACKKPILLLM